MNNQHVISIKNLDIGYSTDTLITNISLDLESGQILGVLGRNGSGKSTFLKTLLSLTPSLKGEVLIDQTPLPSLTRHQLSEKMAAVIQERAFGSLTVEETIMLGRLPYKKFYSGPTKQEQEQLEKVLRQFQLKKFQGKHLSTLSDGERQKVMIARAIMQETPMIVMDEPTVFLDVINAVEVFRLITESAANDNKTWIFSTHQIELALQVCTHLVVFDEGYSHFGSVEQLQKSNILAEVYGKQGVTFDPLTGRVTL